MRGEGRVAFVAILLLIAGSLNVIYGIAAIGDANFFVDNTRYVISSLHTWGWITVILGAVQLGGGLSLLAGNTFGRVIGLIAASLGAIGSLLAVGGAYPFWSLGIFALCVICIHGLVVYGEDERSRRA
ncbi:MAG: hypothetical protein AB7T48_06095 [Solirubrobacterales bacterium]